jgi:hypothetical protein
MRRNMDNQPAGAYLYPASSYFIQKKGQKPYWRTPIIPAHVTDVAADSGGFVAGRINGGKFAYPLEAYVNWLDRWTVTPRWAATMDFCCEPPLTGGDKSVIRARQVETTSNAFEAWQKYQNKAWAWCPTVQGWEVADYVRHATELKPLIEEMQNYYKSRDGEQSSFRVGVGTLCARANENMIRAVVLAVSEVLPGVPLHLWGVKLNILKSKVALPGQVVSVDSAAWNMGMDSGKWRSGDWHRGLGVPRQTWQFANNLPEYQAKIAKALTAPKQLLLPLNSTSEGKSGERS